MENMSEFEDTKVWSDFFNSDQLVVSHLKNYEFLEKIGQGGMGAVYKARQLHPHRLVAIKISKAASTSSVRRFEREMQIASQLEHPGVAKIYDAGVQNDQQYLVMDYIEGQPLDKYFATASTQQKLNIMIEVCSILDYAHRQNIIHRDLKPANIMITNNGKPVVIDFGIAKSTHTRNFDLTKTGEVLGTPNYMAPEQIAGKSSNIDHRVDIYALGAIIYEIICDEKMVASSNSLEALFQIQQANFISPLKINSEADKNLVNIWCKATALNKEHRYKQMMDLRNDLCKAMHGDKVKSYANKRVSKRVFIMATIVAVFAIFATSFLYYVSQQKFTNIELSAHQKEQQRKNEQKLQQIIHRIESRELPKDFDTKDFSDPQRMDLVKTLYNEGFYHRASQMLETFASSNTIALYYKGLIFYEQKQYAPAQEIFEALLKNDNANHKYRYYLGLSAFAQQDLPKALKNLQEAEPSFPKDIILLEALAEIWKKNNDREKAKIYLQRCAALIPSASKYFIELGKIELHNKNYYSAFSYLKKALDTEDFFPALELLHEIPYKEPRLRRWCYQSIMHKFISEKKVKQPDLFSEKWREIKKRYRQDYITQHQAKMRKNDSILPFLRQEVKSEKIKETIRKALIALRYSDHFDREMNQLFENTNLSQNTLRFFRETNAVVQEIKAKEKKAIYHKLAHMHLNNSWHSQKFVDIDNEDCLSMLREEKKVFLKYLLIEGYFHMFGLEPIIEIAKSSDTNIITRMLCCVVLRKNYLAENIEVFYSLPKYEHELSKDELEFLQVNISQAMYVPHFKYKKDTFQRPSPRENKMVPAEKALLWHLVRQSNSRLSSLTAALSLHALLPSKINSPELEKIIFAAMHSDDITLSSYTHSFFWMSPNATEYFPHYKKSLGSKHPLIQEIVLSQIEVFRDHIAELMPEIEKCILQKPSEMLLFRAIFAWTLVKRDTSIFESVLYKGIVENLTPLEQSAILVFELQKLLFDTRNFGKKNQAQIIAAFSFAKQLQQQLKNLPVTSQCMISYVMSLLQLHPSLQRLKNIQDPQLLCYFLYQLYQQVYLGDDKEPFLPLIGAISTKQKYYIAKQFLSHENSKVVEYATSSYVAFASEKERDDMYQQARTSPNEAVKKGVALGYYFALQNAWIKEKKKRSIGFEDLFSNKSLELILIESFQRLREFSQEVALRSPKKLKTYQKWAQRSLTLCPQQSEYIYLHHLFFPEQESTAKMRDAIAINTDKEAGNLKLVYTLRLLDLLLKNNQHIDSDLPSPHEIPAPLLIHFAEIYTKKNRYTKALEHHLRFFLARTKDDAPFAALFRNSEIIYYFMQNNNDKAARAFLEYFYQLYRRANNFEVDRHLFLQNLKKSKPHIDIKW